MKQRWQAQSRRCLRFVEPKDIVLAHHRHSSMKGGQGGRGADKKKRKRKEWSKEERDAHEEANRRKKEAKEARAAEQAKKHQANEQERDPMCKGRGGAKYCQYYDEEGNTL